jgi:hypothetical protein
MFSISWRHVYQSPDSITQHDRFLGCCVSVGENPKGIIAAQFALDKTVRYVAGANRACEIRLLSHIRECNIQEDSNIQSRSNFQKWCDIQWFKLARSPTSDGRSISLDDTMSSGLIVYCLRFFRQQPVQGGQARWYSQAVYRDAKSPFAPYNFGARTTPNDES